MNSKLFRGTLDTIILDLLHRNEEMYGYEIVRKVKEISADAISITEGALYPALHKLEQKKFLTTDVRSIGNRRRKYYRLTSKGNKECQVQISEMRQFIKQLNLIFNPQLSTYAT